MRVQIVLYASLVHLLPEGSSSNTCSIDMKEGSTVSALLERFQVRADLPKIVFLNGRHANYDQLLKEGDRVAVFPPIAGG